MPHFSSNRVWGMSLAGARPHSGLTCPHCYERVPRLFGSHFFMTCFLMLNGF